MRHPAHPVVALLACGAAACAFAQSCEESDARTLRVTVRDGEIVRANAPRELFGFNVPWRDFQLGFMKNGKVRPDLVALLKVFDGAVYRYPGGSPSNSFQWRAAALPVGQRAKQHADFENYARPDLGPREFADFVSAVGGRAILTLNLLGPPKKILDLDELRKDARETADTLKSIDGFDCAGEPGCRLMALELGNEIDWQPFNISARDYAERAEAVLAEVGPAWPKATWIANGRTAPWAPRSRDARSYNEDVARALGARTSGIAIHPYYDGIAVPTALDYVRDYASQWRAGRSNDGKVYVTEHARWPSMPPSGRWNERWYEATGLGGAISSADFLLGLVPMPAVAAANWHALATVSPWQLVRWDRGSDKLIPSPVYHGMSALRRAYLDHAVRVDYTPTQDANYSGRYDQRIVAMRSASGDRVSLLAINRSPHPVTLQVEWAGGQRGAGQAQLRWITGENNSLDNSAAQPDNVAPRSREQSVAAGRRSSTWCMPARAVFSVREP